MKLVLAMVIAVMSAVLGAILVAARSPAPVRWTMLLVSVAIGALVAEGATVLWTGAPSSALPPAVDGVLLGGLIGWVASRRRPPAA
jgi:hypothetical protein